jgi:hypothetical protein
MKFSSPAAAYIWAQEVLGRGEVATPCRVGGIIPPFPCPNTPGATQGILA